MRGPLIAITLASAAAHAGPMRPFADAASVCKELTGSDAKTRCRSVAGTAVKDFGSVELYVATGDSATRYAVVATSGGKLWMSDPIAPAEVLDPGRPTLRVVTAAGRSFAVAVLAQTYHHEKDRWSGATLIACGQAAKGQATCTVRTWGGRGNSCKVKLAPDGQVIASCDTKDAIAIE